MPGARLSASTQRTSGALRCRRLLGHRPEAPGTRSRRSPRYQYKLPGWCSTPAAETVPEVRQPVRGYPYLLRQHRYPGPRVGIADRPLNEVPAVPDIGDALAVHQALLAEERHQPVLADADTRHPV